ncbi:X-Pro aminopeptidase [Defluviimonas sp. 20V17]|uniref:Xaa-Pro aminopeptidase n=1 Tax=Allgaiera indica TaxID=765699 RepID=A0AAN4UPG4_9RHOB|nr:aminopeptidase P family protein [Allgaiera indica]KDB03811.1 X-Pro aminopeptidase [Defluviimonas sp. 20V17]GHE00036.1 Xaa-Pro aminopeptidase [Allgaiera indica]SDW38359.1 Xaa-Pro aminopeptidase [Allgaiera indica]
MFQSFTVTARPEQGPPRLAALRARLADEGLAGFIVPRADAHQGEYVAPHDERLAWLTGFTGSAGFCIVLPDIAGVFIDGRYRTQVKAQVDLRAFTPVPWPDTLPGPWLREHLNGGRVGFDPWLHTADEIAKIDEALKGSGITLVPVANPVDAIWDDQPAPPCGRVFAQPLEFAGRSGAEKRAELAARLAQDGQRAAVLTLPDSIAWLCNIRGSDVARNPVVHAFAVLHADARLTLFITPGKLDDAFGAHLGEGVSLRPPEAFMPALRTLDGPVRVDRATAPLAVSRALEDAGVEVAWGQDPCLLPKARKNPAEIQGARDAHLRDGAAMVEFLAWLDATAPGDLTEIDVVTQLESCRSATNALREISFETICGSGPNGAIMHYRVTEETNRKLREDELMVIDSGGQYVDGTTDITRTVVLGTPPEGAAEAFTRVLQGMIAISRARWPKGLAGRDLDPLARYHLWLAGQDFNHGTGHGVGSYLSVHEGPQRLSRISEVPLEPGMILSNEPGYYREGAFGIRIENLVVVDEAPALPGGDPERSMLCFETMTFAPIDRRLIVTAMLSPGERAWLNGYHADVYAKIGPKVTEFARDWLQRATAPV